MGGYPLPVEVNNAAVAHSTEIKVEPMSGLDLAYLKMPCIPYGSLIVLKLRQLAVEIPRDIKTKPVVE